MGANIAGIYGAQIFRQEDRPYYRVGFTINCAVLAAGLALAIVRFVDDLIRRRRSRNQLQQAEGNSSDGETKAAEAGALAGQPEPQTVGFQGDVKEATFVR